MELQRRVGRRNLRGWVPTSCDSQFSWTTSAVRFQILPSLQSILTSLLPSAGQFQLPLASFAFAQSPKSSLTHFVGVSRDASNPGSSGHRIEIVAMHHASQSGFLERSIVLSDSTISTGLSTLPIPALASPDDPDLAASERRPSIDRGRSLSFGSVVPTGVDKGVTPRPSGSVTPRRLSRIRADEGPREEVPGVEGLAALATDPSVVLRDRVEQGYGANVRFQLRRWWGDADLGGAASHQRHARRTLHRRVLALDRTFVLLPCETFPVSNFVFSQAQRTSRKTPASTTLTSGGEASSTSLPASFPAPPPPPPPPPLPLNPRPLTRSTATSPVPSDEATKRAPRTSKTPHTPPPPLPSFREGGWRERLPSRRARLGRRGGWRCSAVGRNGRTSLRAFVRGEFFLVFVAGFGAGMRAEVGLSGRLQQGGDYEGAARHAFFAGHLEKAMQCLRLCKGEFGCCSPK